MSGQYSKDSTKAGFDAYRTFTGADLCPMIECYMNTGTLDPNPTNLATTTCT